ncbi:MAG: hypothetical protein HZA04_05170 [Nitrospinae bacterium]|nr:hypothetical protein [Nitrospinota bacterium]
MAIPFSALKNLLKLAIELGNLTMPIFNRWSEAKPKMTGNIATEDNIRQLEQRILDLETSEKDQAELAKKMAIQFQEISQALITIYKRTTIAILLGAGAIAVAILALARTMMGQ